MTKKMQDIHLILAAFGFGSTGKTIGGNVTGAGNLISGNTNQGVLITANSNTVQGNIIGLNAAGTGALPNNRGVDVSASSVLIGTDGDGVNDANERNIISGNIGRGVVVGDANVVAGNWIGLDATGAISANETGVQVTGIGTRVGTNGDSFGDIEERNVISGNTLEGIIVRDATTSGAVIAGNYIGTDPLGTLVRPNAIGVSISGGASNSTIGGTTSIERNIISGNAAYGLRFEASTTNNVVVGNFVGVQSDGITSLLNGVGAFTVESGAPVKGTGSFSGNVVNQGSIAPGNSPGIITINGNYSQSAGAVLDMELAGTNAATPEFDQLIVNGTVSLAGTLNVALISGFQPDLGDSFRIIDNDGTDAIVGTFDGLAEGATFTVGSKLMSITYMGGTGNDVVLRYVSAIYTVTTTSNSGAGSLRQAIEDANANPGRDQIDFDIPTSDPNYNAGTSSWTITLTSVLPSITDPVVIDGTTAAGYAGTPVVEVNFGNVGPGQIGLHVISGFSTIRGLALNRSGGVGVWIASHNNFIEHNYIGTDGDGTADVVEGNLISANVQSGIEIYGVGTTNNVVAGNFIGTNAAGTSPLANTGSGVNASDGAKNTRIGTDRSNDAFNANERNIISGNLGSGINISSSASSGVVVAGNWVGLDGAGSAAIPNAGGGVRLNRAVGARIGTNADGIADELERNVVSGNSGSGITIQGGVEQS